MTSISAIFYGRLLGIASKLAPKGHSKPFMMVKEVSNVIFAMVFSNKETLPILKSLFILLPKM